MPSDGGKKLAIDNNYVAPHQYQLPVKPSMEISEEKIND